ncbi:MAG: hypothetical protein A2744_00265 [Candidatus Buchananbacteria bacterium RIFCSPHIGHO2_01_FULL_44_11]|uniref:ABC transporter domain-containing protein n=1 Tax=Candidatus Buchananbacteria bacterium RIFCSPHIGHO2_01_FULL_44_11 TaxID=1797535 RepID=A0A1G1Y1W5_9BACT|nr:MAG: hypothetical protein A2744_00265 [Candidatus Buchananbacteria bacterium RIFCSPHIGHO2_01_FULL_44_11]
MITVKDITFNYPGKNSQGEVGVFKDFSLEIFDGEFLSLVGPSGCGKTTLVNIIAGYLKPFSGGVVINGDNITLPGKDRIVINQENDLFEWMTVYENMKLITKDDDSIDKYLLMTHLTKFKNYYPRELSGGMKKRLSLARALVVDSGFIIMDEPFGSLDNQIKEKLHEEVLKIVKQSGKTILLVTHDVEEAIFLSDRILLLSGKPVTIKQEIKIPFNHPRYLSLRDSAEFSKFRSIVRQAINHH